MTYGTYVLVTDKTTKDNLRHLRPGCTIAEWHSISLIGHTYILVRLSHVHDLMHMQRGISPSVYALRGIHPRELIHQQLTTNLKAQMQGVRATLGPLKAFLSLTCEGLPSDSEVCRLIPAPRVIISVNPIGCTAAAHRSCRELPGTERLWSQPMPLEPSGSSSPNAAGAGAGDHHQGLING